MTMETIAECIAAATDRLKSAGIEGPKRDARLLLAYALGVDRAVIIGYPERTVPKIDDFLSLVERRASGMPMAQILGRREFWGLEFRVTSDTLDPRPDSETLVEAVLAAIDGRRTEALNILDLGTGTGCLLLSVLSELPSAEGVGVDLSPAAIAVARENAARLQLAGRTRFAVCDWMAGLSGKFDIVLANPPYIERDDIKNIQSEVASFEPRLALDGGIDGLDAYRRLAAELPGFVAAGAVAAFEVGIGQWDSVAALMEGAGMRVAPPVADLGGIDRCVICHCSEGFT